MRKNTSEKCPKPTLAWASSMPVRKVSGCVPLIISVAPWPEKPDYVEAQYHIGLTHLNLMNRDAIRAFEQVVEMDPDHPDAYYRLGFMYEYDLLKKEGAIEYYEKQLAVNPAHKDAMWRLGQLYRVLSRTDQAARTLSRLMQTQGTNQRQYMLELAEVYLERKNYEKAETLFETYLAGPEHQRADAL